MAKKQETTGEPGYDPNNPNLGLGLEKFNYQKWREWTPELWAEYQKIVQSLKHRVNYDWEQYKAVGMFKQVLDEISDTMIPTNILVGIELVENAPVNITRMEVQHIESWGADRQGRLKMLSGLNAQIFDKDNNRQNSRYYFLRKPESEANNA